MLVFRCTSSVARNSMGDTSDDEIDLATFDEHEFEIPLVTCEWLDCGQQFWELEPMIDHIHDAHMSSNKTKYCCEWTGCPRRGKVQTSRFALLSHIRSHTGEKPFMCPKPECDKAFTRTDALQKHARIQHSNEGRKPPPPNTMAAAMLNLSTADNSGSVSSKKRKLEDGTPLDVVKDGMSTPKHGGIDDEELDDEETPARNQQQYSNSTGGANGSVTNADGTTPIAEEDDDDEEILEFFRQHPDQSPDYLRYVATFNKHDLLMSEHETLLHELELLRSVEQKLVKAKDNVLQQLLVNRFGNDANHLFTPITRNSTLNHQQEQEQPVQGQNHYHSLQQEHQPHQETPMSAN